MRETRTRLKRWKNGRELIDAKREVEGSFPFYLTAGKRDS